MSKTLLEKMFFKPHYNLAILNLPEELKEELYTPHNTQIHANDKYTFILAFFTKEQDLKKEVTKLKNSLLPEGLIWIAYPKNKLLETDLNRDILHGLLKKFELDSVSIVSLNATWSAMRFKII